VSSQFAIHMHGSWLPTVTILGTDKSPKADLLWLPKVTESIKLRRVPPGPSQPPYTAAYKVIDILRQHPSINVHMKHLSLTKGSLGQESKDHLYHVR